MAQLKQLLVEMDEETKKKFKQITLAHDTSMAEVVRNCIAKYIADNTKSIVY